MIQPTIKEEEKQIAFLIQKCPNMKFLRQIHAHILTRLLPISTLSFLLSKILSFTALSPLGDIHYARTLFSHIPNPGIFAYNSIIRALSYSQYPSKQPFHLYKRMITRGYPTPNTYTLAFLLKSCSNLMAHQQGQQVHAQILRSGFALCPYVQSSLLNFYSKCDEIRLAEKVFDEITERNLVCWSVMISGYSRLGMVNEALSTFREMQEDGIEPDDVSLVAVVSACAMAGALDIGTWIHTFIKKKMISVDLELNTSLVNMYAKCGFIEKAKQIFDAMPVKDSKAWSSMIVGLAIHGLAEDALEAFSRMEQAKVKPNHVTFIGILSACAHGGLVSAGKKYWSSMPELGIEPSMEHYGCMVDLLCRGGLVQEAYNFAQTIPSPNPVIWRTLLVGYRKNGMVDQAEMVAEQLLELEPLNAGNYILVANLYASVSQWEKMSHVRKKMKDKGMKAVPGCTSIEVDGFVHEFVMGDWSHPEAELIKTSLRDVSVRIHNTGYEPYVSAVLHNVDDEEKENVLNEHSERLAIAYGLLKIKPPAPIRIIKNLRMCEDCHEVTKIISKVYGREIIVRDRVRFHKFVNGLCSCKDYW
ncbi:pentatricopeptide repeat-containing protein At1g59720, chloroplastic/mitochondrial-like [Euphorbia lathyris]|uniref:pentatricopeptide repeat-containing protein At1g59720, chloroplastic/mitochondrial-like n=1 Tax=Euphorbia lathyris TaxID=212925 RepID=UPI003314455A